MTENSINRYKIGSADNLKTNADGSTTIYIQNQSPGKDKESNWLPARSIKNCAASLPLPLNVFVQYGRNKGLVGQAIAQRLCF